ncbi:arylesterase [Marinicella litoralis]|uniref:Acyl-CoA thioesterase-1 n=1 Tax=Marinicella litoralis TaxID=644220 RepID=A0A4R6XJ04_9GAMM|nr:arylesterase [Marinicella litoralis]TDR19462.1 acyl-CoA thioesterase-1 [Marinicella litoralis]
MTKHIYNFKITPLLLWLLVLYGLTACSEQSSHTTTNGSEGQANLKNKQKTSQSYVILALGDSLTEGLGVKQDGNYPAILEKRLKAKGYDYVKVVNSGLSGETSSGLKNRLDWVLQLKPQLTILNIGANDAMRGLPLALTRDNISEIINRIKAADSKVILAGMQIYDNLGREYVTGFKDMYPKLAKQHGLSMIPFFLDQVAGNPQLNQADMIHPTSAGYEVIVDQNVLPVVLSNIEAH